MAYMQVLILPLMGPFHLRYPAYNAVTVRDLVAAFRPDAVVLSSLTADAFDTPRWQDTPEIPLPLSVVPWARQQGLAVHGILEPSPDASAQADFRRYALEYPKLQQQLFEVDARLRPLEGLLELPLNLARIQAEVLPVIRDHAELREAILEDGPASDWLRSRISTMKARLLALNAERIALLASIDQVPFLEDVLKDTVHLVDAPQIEASEASRNRSLFDFAFRVDVPEPGNLIAKLKTIALPEARYHQANLLFANGHGSEALEVLEAVSQGDFSEPYYLPGYVLTRLGQLYDLAQDRKAALRSYRGVRALAYAPLEALQEAEKGLLQPFGAATDPAT